MTTTHVSRSSPGNGGLPPCGRVSVVAAGADEQKIMEHIGFMRLRVGAFLVGKGKLTFEQASKSTKFGF